MTTMTKPEEAQMTQRHLISRGPRPFDIIEVTIDRIEPGGAGVARYPVLLGPQKEERDYKVSVRKALPGDRVRVCIEEVRRRHIQARIEELLTPSSSRIEQAPCPHFGLREQEGKGCGGCTLQSTSYANQLTLKLEMIQRLMRHNNLPEQLVSPPLGMSNPWFYRNKMEFSFGDYRERGQLTLGLHPSGYKHDVLDIDRCSMLSEQAMIFVQAARAWARQHQVPSFHFRRNQGFLRTLTIREGKRTGERIINVTSAAVELVSFDGQEIPSAQVVQSLADALVATAQTHELALNGISWTQHNARRGQRTTIDDTLLYGQLELREELHLPQGKRLRFDIHPRAFFQPNTFQAEQIYSHVLGFAGLLDQAAGESDAHILDLYCGTGTIGLCMAPYAGRVTGIELNPDAVANAQANAAKNGIENVEFIAGDVGQVLASGQVNLESISLVVVDPPRAGLMAQALEQLKLLNAPRLVYVSCNPDSLVRDLSALKSHGYKVNAIQPIDMFPHTHHIEQVVSLSL